MVPGSGLRWAPLGNSSTRPIKNPSFKRTKLNTNLGSRGGGNARDFASSSRELQALRKSRTHLIPDSSQLQPALSRNSSPCFFLKKSFQPAKTCLLACYNEPFKQFIGVQSDFSTYIYSELKFETRMFFLAEPLWQVKTRKSAFPMNYRFSLIDFTKILAFVTGLFASTPGTNSRQFPKSISSRTTLPEKIGTMS